MNRIEDLESRLANLINEAKVDGFTEGVINAVLRRGLDETLTRPDSLKESIVLARDLNEAWFLCLRAVLKDGCPPYEVKSGSSRGHKRTELDFVSVHITNPGIRPLVPVVPEGVAPPTSQDFVEKNYLRYLLTSEKAPNEVYTYGEDIERQLWEAIRLLKEDPNTNKACIIIGSAESIKLDDPPCLKVVDFRIRYGRLHFVVYFRSWDLWAGFPSNLAGLQIMKEFAASEIGVEDGEMIVLSKGMHLHEYSLDLAKAVARF